MDKSEGNLYICSGCKAILILFLIVVISSFCKVFIFGIYAIPGSSMESTLLMGDRVLVNKLKYGPRLPRSPAEIPGLYILCFIIDNIKNKNVETCWEYHRIIGYSEVERNEIIVFNHPVSDKVFIKRCVGLPGDSIGMINGNLFVNNVLVQGSEIGSATNISCLKAIDLQEQNYYELNPGCYFMLGDNRDNSNDSRHWGVVHKENIIGESVLVLFSLDDSKFRWDRFMKRIE
jgi:signal peptidase I